MKHDHAIRTMLIASAMLLAAAPALAEAQTPSISGNSWIAIAIIVGVVALILLFISGALGISKRDTSDEDGAGVGVLEGIDEDDEDKKKKKR